MMISKPIQDPRTLRRVFFTQQTLLFDAVKLMATSRNHIDVCVGSNRVLTNAAVVFVICGHRGG